MWEGLDEDVWVEVRKIILHHIKAAAFREFSKRGWSLNGSNGQRIDESFDLVLKGGEITLTSTFPGLGRYATGIVIKKDDEGNIVAASLPAYMGGNWVAPTKRHDNFVYQGLHAGMEEAAPLLLLHYLHKHFR